VLAACSSDKGTVQNAEPPAAATTAAPVATTTVDTTFTGRGSEEYCKLSSSYKRAADQLSPTNDAQVRQFMQDAARDIKAAVAVAPSEIKADVEKVATSFDALVNGLVSVNFDYTRLPPELIATFMSEDLRRASTRVTAYARDVCGQS
jgi:hypothetical protein